MPHNRADREVSVKGKYDFVVFGGEYSVLHALLAVADGIITGGNTTFQYLQNEVVRFGIDIAAAMKSAGLDPTTETLYFNKFIFENWETPIPGIRVPLPNKFVPYCAARKKQPPVQSRDVASVGGRFRAVNDRSNVFGYSAGFPNFHEANHGQGVVYGTILLKPGYTEWRDILRSDLGNPNTPEERFRAVNDWAGKNGFAAAFPNFHEADYGNGVVYGTILLKPNAVDWRDILRSDLGNPNTPEERIRAANDWAGKNGYRAALPNFHEANHGQGTVYGTLLIKNDAADWRDISVSELQAL